MASRRKNLKRIHDRELCDPTGNETSAHLPSSTPRSVSHSGVPSPVTASKPSVAGIVYEFGGDNVQKFYWGTSEILLPVYRDTASAVAANPEVTAMVRVHARAAAASTRRRRNALAQSMPTWLVRR